MKVSIIIRCRNEAKHIGKLLNGIQKQSYKDVEIIVVDSGSTDETLAIVEQYPVQLIHIRPEDFSFGYALNVGCKAATGDILLMASAHVYPVYEDWISLMVAPFEDLQTASVYGKQRGNEVTQFSEHQIFAKWFPDKSVAKQSYPFCNNANCAVRKSLWEMQPYDETLTGLEDLDWAKKIIAQGYHLAYQAEATIVHVHEETWKSVYNRYRREAIALRLIMKNETFNFLTFLQLLTSNIWNDWRQAWHEKQWLEEAASIVAFRTMQFWGTYRGYKESYLMDNEVRERFYYPKGFIQQHKSESTVPRKKIDYE